MKKFSFILIFIISLVLMPRVKALDVNTDFIGNSVVNEGYNTVLYVKVNTNSSFNKIDICYNTTGNISIEDVNAIGGMTISKVYAKRAIIVSKKPIASGTVVFAFTIKGTAPGNGTLRIPSITVYTDKEQKEGKAVSYDFLVQQAKGQEELLDEVNQSALKKATLLVESAEKSLSEDDYNAAKKSVDALIESTAKVELEERLNKVSFNLEVDKKQDKKVKEVKMTKTASAKPWIIFSSVLALALIIETIYMIIKLRNKY